MILYSVLLPNGQYFSLGQGITDTVPDGHHELLPWATQMAHGDWTSLAHTANDAAALGIDLRSLTESWDLPLLESKERHDYPAGD